MTELIKFRPKLHKVEPRCDFCFKPKSSCEVLVSGGVGPRENHVCDECVEKMKQLLETDAAD